MNKSTINLANLILAFVLCSFIMDTPWTTITNEQASKKIVDLSNSMKKMDNYSVSLIHAVYTSHTAEQPFEQKIGYYKHWGKFNHSLLLGIETVQNESIQVVIDSSNKTVIVSNAKDQKDMMFETPQLQLCSKIEEQLEGSSLGLRFIFIKGLPLNEIRLQFNTISKVLEKIEMYNSQAMYVSNPDSGTEPTEIPKTIISFNDYKRQSCVKEDFNVSRIVTLINNKYILTDLYKKKGYIVYDNRINK